MRVLLITGRLAEPAVRQVIAECAATVGADYQIAVLKISVAALMQVDWVARQLPAIPAADRVIVPGWCLGDLQQLSALWGVSVERGPKDIFDLPAYLSGKQREIDLQRWSIEIIAEINHAPHLTLAELRQRALELSAQGADLIDVGMIPGERWEQTTEAIRILRAEGLRVSIDSFDECEVTAAVEAGAELVLSCNQTNVKWLSQLPVESVVIPDDFTRLDSLQATIEQLEQAGRRYRIDPILEPIGFGFGTSLERYFRTRRRFPTAAMMMGVGNLTELTEVDSAGVNLLLAALCEELQIESVLTTQVINWARTSVQELDCSRRMTFRSLRQRVLPKHVGGNLLLSRDARVTARGDAALRTLASQLTDRNFRIFAERGEIHLMNGTGYWHGTDPYEVFDAAAAETGALTQEHAFYLGYELCKARTALTLGKQYTQDQALNWGFLSVSEDSALTRRRHLARELREAATIQDNPPEPAPKGKITDGEQFSASGGADTP